MILDPVTVNPKEMLREAFEKRFFSGYNGTQRSFVLELQVFFHPAFKSLRCLDSILSGEQAKSKRENI